MELSNAEGASAQFELHINELVLHGFAPREHERIGQELLAELNRLLLERGIPASLERGASVETLDAGAFELTRSARPEQIGRQVARALYERLSQ